MSSPLAKTDKRLFDKLLITFHKRFSHYSRVDRLSRIFTEIIKKYNSGDKQIRLLDIGCGDMSIARKVAAACDRVVFTCLDIYPNTENWDDYIQFDGKVIPFSDKEFDIVLFSDVLHHDFANSLDLILEAKRVSELILIKDHFEYGFFSRKILQLSDFIGNYGYGIPVPGKYFTEKSWDELLEAGGMTEIERRCPLQVYDTIIRIFLKNKYQFISLTAHKSHL